MYACVCVYVCVCVCVCVSGIGKCERGTKIFTRKGVKHEKGGDVKMGGCHYFNYFKFQYGMCGKSTVSFNTLLLVWSELIQDFIGFASINLQSPINHHAFIVFYIDKSPLQSTCLNSQYVYGGGGH